MITARWCGLLATAMMAGCSTTNVYETVGTGDAASDGAPAVDSAHSADGTTTGADGGEAGDGGVGRDASVSDSTGDLADASNEPDTYQAPDTYAPSQDSGAEVCDPDGSTPCCISLGWVSTTCANAVACTNGPTSGVSADCVCSTLFTTPAACEGGTATWCCYGSSQP